MTRALVVGCGSIGERHVRNLVDLGIDVVACDVDPTQTEAVADLVVKRTTDYETALTDEALSCVLVCTPPQAHVDQAIEALSVNLPTFIEKPLAPTHEDALPLVERAAASSETTYVACNMRFHPPVSLLDDWLQGGDIGEPQFLRLRFGHALSNWRPGNYTDYYSASEAAGGGIILDAIHELDVADHWLGGSDSVLCAAGHLSNLEIDAEDTAEIVLRRDDRMAEVHIDYLRQLRCRTYEVIGSDGFARWHAEGKDPEQSTVSLYDADGKRTTTRTFESDLNGMYRREMEDFLKCVRGDAAPPVDAARGARLIQLADLAKEAAETGRVRTPD